MSVSLPDEDKTPPQTLEQLQNQTNKPPGETPFNVDARGFAEFTPGLGAPVGGDEEARNRYVRELTLAAVNQGWNQIFGAGLTPDKFAEERLSYSSAGAQPVATKPNPSNPGTFYTLYSDGTVLEDSYDKTPAWQQMMSRGGGSAGGAGGGARSYGGGAFGAAASQFAMGGGGGGFGGGAGQSARDAAILLAQQFGLGAEFFSQIEQFIFDDISEDSLILALRSTEAYKKRFAANATRVAKGLPALSEAEYIRMEQLYRQELRAAGLPPSFYDDLNDFKNYIENDLSYNEFVSRVGLAKRASQMANPEVKRQLKDLYGVGDAELVGYFLNPDKTTSLLQRQFNVAQTAGALSKAGFGNTMAEELTTSVVGGRPETVLDYGELEKAAQTAATARPLSQQVLGGERGAVTEQDLLRGIVAEDVQGQRRLQQEQQRRLSEYQGGGGFVQGEQGVIGLRSSSR
jgi:hypothetical protein